MNVMFRDSSNSRQLTNRLAQGIAAAAVSIILMPGTSAAQETVQFESGRAGYATGITNLDVDGTEYDVTFVSQRTAASLYDGDFDFTSSAAAESARNATADALDAAGALEVGTEGVASSRFSMTFNIPFAFVPPTEQLVSVFKSVQDGGLWSKVSEQNQLFYSGDERTFATFVKSGSSGNSPPVADANGPHTGTVGSPVAFDGSGSTDPDDGGSIVSYFWYFGDGGTGTGVAPTHTYMSADVWNVILIVTDDMGARGSDWTQASIDQGDGAPLADAGGPYRGEANIGVAFNGAGSASSNPGGSIDQYDWDYGDGSMADVDAGPTPNHAYMADGLYEVTLTVTDELGATDGDTTWAVIGAAPGEPPVADAGGPYSGAVDATIKFDGTASYDPDGGEIVSWAWSFGDGNSDNTGPTPSHVYTLGGTYDVTLLVQDDEGRIDSNQTTATIGTGNLPPEADANGPYTGTAGVAVNFDGTASDDPDGDIISYIWDFGDGASGSGQTTSHTYSSEGLYNVTLTVTDDQGTIGSSDTSAEIAAAPPPPADDDDCFIATAAYGSFLEPEVTVLRGFRDRYLMTNGPGQAFVDWYYRTSPPFADVIAESESLRAMTRVALTPLVYGIKYPAATGFIILLMFVAPLGWTRRKA